MRHNSSRQTAFQFIVLMGLVSLFGDMVYEGARSVTGPYLQLLGASAVAVGIIAGLGEFLGYAIRILSGYVSDKTGLHWSMTIAGYGLLCCVPLIGITDLWQIAALFILLERIGKGIRSPARDTILSHVAKKVGRGMGFGLHEALDQIGAIIGPTIFSTSFILGYGYKNAFKLLWLPALICMAVLIVARIKVPAPERYESSIEPENGSYLSKLFWLYSIFIFLTVSGFANFQIISYHLKYRAIISEGAIPIFYALAMGVDAIMALFIGKFYDKKGTDSLIMIPVLTAPIPIFAFSFNAYEVLFAMILWGAVMGIHETIMRAVIADIIHKKKRGIAYGIFNTIYGISWLVGSSITGYLYEISVTYIVVFSVVVEVLSILVFLWLKRQKGLPVYSEKN